MRANNKLVTILGPTASGKTSLAIKLAKKYNGEIVCADSRTIYKGMDIGTAKPSIDEQEGVVHHLLDICQPNKPFSVAEFKAAAISTIGGISKRGKLPFLVGGSGLYIDSVLYDYQFRNEMNAAELAELNNISLVKLQKIAQQKYPREYLAIDAKNRRRVEQLITKGPSKDNDRKTAIINSLVLGVSLNKPKLRQNIANRTKVMLNNNLVQETQQLRKKFGDADILLTTTGYTQVIKYLDNQIAKDDLEQAIIDATWQLSRKQMTWFRRNKHIHWVNTKVQAEKYITNYLEA